MSVGDSAKNPETVQYFFIQNVLQLLQGKRNMRLFSQLSKLEFFRASADKQLTECLLQLLTLQLYSKAELGDISCLRGFFFQSIASSD